MTIHALHLYDSWSLSVDLTKLTVQHIIELLGFCIHNTYFLSQGKCYDQMEGVAMGSSVSPIVANMYMKDLQEKTLRTVKNPCRLWRQYVDDNFVIQQIAHKENFLKHINSLDQSIKFTVEDIYPDASMPFMDTLVIPGPNRTQSI